MLRTIERQSMMLKNNGSILKNNGSILKNNGSKYLTKYKIKGIYNNKPDSTYGSGSESEEGSSIKSEMAKAKIVKKPRLHNMSEKVSQV